MTAVVEPGAAGAHQRGRLAGRYTVDGLLGTGATAEVRSGWDTRLDRPVAVKLLRPELASDARVRRSFTEEARAAARLSHPNVVAVFDSADPEGDGTPYIVMERLPGQTLRTRLRSAGPLPVAAVRDLAVQMLSALQAGAAAGLVHCDIKPGNILAAADGRWKLADFGIARSTGGAVRADRRAYPLAGMRQPGDWAETATLSRDETATGLVTGTPAYLAPERLHGEPATESSDIFALGVVLYEALTGERPYRTMETYPWTAALSGEPAMPVQTLCPEVDRDLAAVIDRAVQLDRDRRFATAAEMSTALTAGSAPLRQVGTRSRRSRRVTAGGGLGVAATAAFLVLLATGELAHPARAGTGPVVPAPAAVSTPAGPAGTQVTAATTAPTPNTVPAATPRPAPTTVPATHRGARTPAGAPAPSHHPGPLHKGPGGKPH